MGEPVNQRKPILLYVDDCPIGRVALGGILRSAGFEVLEATTGQEALDRVGVGPDLVLLDVCLPDMDGFEVCRLLKSDAATCAIPVLMVSGVAVRSEDRIQGLEGGADGYLTKPVEPAEVVAHARALLRARRAEETLAASERRFRAIIEKSFDAVALVDVGGTCIYVSPSSEHVLGYRPEEYLGRNTFDLIHPDDLASVRVRFEQVTGNPGDSQTSVHRVRHENGSWRWLEARTTNQLHDPAIQAVVINYRDVTAKKESEEALHREREFLRAVLENIDEGVVACDTQGTITFLNRVTRELASPTGAPFPISEWVKHFAVYHSDWKTPMRQDEHLLLRALQGHEIRNAELVVVSESGRGMVIRASGQPLFGCAGNRLGAVVVLHDVTEQKDLEESRCLLASIVESSEDAIIGKTLDGQITSWNAGAEHLYGYRAEEVLDRPISLLHPPESRDELTSIFERVQQGERIQPFETVRVHKNGTRIAVSLRVSPMRDAGGIVVGVSTIARDITARKRAEAALARDAVLLASVRDSVIVTDLEGVVTYWNEGATRLFGWTAAEMIGRPYAERFPEPARSEVARQIRQQAEGGDWTGEYQDYRKDGSRVWIDARVSLIRDPAGRPAAILGLAHDIDARKRAEAERDDLLRRLQLQFERMPIGCILADARGRVTDWNPAAEKIFGHTRDEMLGRDTSILNSTLVQPVDTNGHVVRENVTRGGRAITCEWFDTPLRGPDGRLDGFLAMVTDVTERRKFEEHTQQAQKMTAIGQLAGGIAHDFNNLLTIINSYCDILLEGLSTDDPTWRPLTQIKRAGARSAALTGQLLAFGRKQLVAFEVLDLNLTVLETETMLRRVIGEDIELVTHLDPSIGRIRADPGQVEQVLMNLAVNARDAMPQGGRLTIETAPCDPCQGTLLHQVVNNRPHVRLSMTDTGCGMSEEVRSRVFEPFFTTKSTGKGTGLGLSVVHGIITLSEGQIEVQSEVGKGTTINVYLPAMEEPVQPGKIAAGTFASNRGTESLLLVEDEEDVRSLLLHHLRSLGYVVHDAGDGPAALRIAEQLETPIDLLVADVVMPGMGGRQLAERLARRWGAMGVLYISGYTDDAVVRHGIQREKVELLQKPFLPQELSAKVREILDRQRK